MTTLDLVSSWSSGFDPVKADWAAQSACHAHINLIPYPHLSLVHSHTRPSPTPRRRLGPEERRRLRPPTPPPATGETSGAPTPPAVFELLTMSCRSGYSGEGGDSIMSWPRSPSPPSEELLFQRQFDDPHYASYQDEIAQLEREKIHMEEVIHELRRQVDEEKANSKRCRGEKLKLELDLAISDEGIEDLEADVDEKTRALQELEVKDAAARKIIQEFKLKGEVKTRCIVAVLSVAFTLVAILVSTCVI